ncbi:MAG: hypothetical protein P1V97_00245, partial [Planctomycetota bacterium]|nr:hypothetical protein [Planctomycetota bacterium]
MGKAKDKQDSDRYGGEERREATRVYLFGGRVEITKKNGKKFVSRLPVVNVSTGGIYLRFPCKARKLLFFKNTPEVSEDDLLHFKLFLPPQYDAFKVGGHIVRIERIDKEQIGLGIQFSKEYSNEGTLERIERALRSPVKQSQRLRRKADERDRHSARIKKARKEKKIKMNSRRIDNSELLAEVAEKAPPAEKPAKNKTKSATRKVNNTTILEEVAPKKTSSEEKVSKSKSKRRSNSRRVDNSEVLAEVAAKKAKSDDKISKSKSKRRSNSRRVDNSEILEEVAAKKAKSDDKISKSKSKRRSNSRRVDNSEILEEVAAKKAKSDDKISKSKSKRR